MSMSNDDVVKAFVALLDETDSALIEFRGSKWYTLDTFEMDNPLGYAMKNCRRVVGLVRGTTNSGFRFLSIFMMGQEWITLYIRSLNGTDQKIILAEGTPAAMEIYTALNHKEVEMVEGGLEYIQFLIKKAPSWIKKLSSR